MTRSDLRDTLTATQRRIIDAIARIDRIADHYALESIIAADTMRSALGAPPGGRGTNSDPTGNAVSRIGDLDDKWTNWIDAINALAEWSILILERGDAITRVRAARVDVSDITKAQACTGLLGEDTCPQGNVANDHHTHDPHDGTITTTPGLCDHCWHRSCRTCHNKPRQPDRTQCAGCRQRELRSKGSAA